MNASTQEISVIAPISAAVQRVKTVLFSPFDLQRWLVIGFGAWLATLGEGGGGGGGGGNWNPGNHRNAGAEWEQAKEWVVANLAWLLPLVIGIVLVVVVIGLLVLWLSSRGRFIFLHCVATNRAEVVSPWRATAVLGNSLFWFRLGLGLVGFAIMLPLVGLIVWPLVLMLQREQVSVSGVLVMVAAVFAVILMTILFALVTKFTKDFIVPIMWLRRQRAVPAWSEFLAILRVNKAHFALYILFHILISMVIGGAVLALMILTCCIACCLLSIPYLGTVLLLPVVVFLRAYSLHYLAQYGPAYDVFAAETGAPLPA